MALERPDALPVEEQMIEAPGQRKWLLPAGWRARLRGVSAEQVAWMLLGFAAFVLAWYLLVTLKVWRFEKLPDPLTTVREWVSPRPVFKYSIFTEAYYRDIWVSGLRVLAAFTAATVLGFPLGILLGWRRVARDYLFPVLELIRPIPPLAWVPLAILMMPGQGLAIVYLCFLASFFATVLNTMLGVFSIDESYIRAAYCLGSRERHVMWHVIIPGALPQTFTGLQVGMGVAWFSLVAAEMLSGESGLGYRIFEAYMNVQGPVILIAMFTLGYAGYACSAAVRLVGTWLMRWTVRG
jgi:NitT/TauT family transport system permease protein